MCQSRHLLINGRDFVERSSGKTESRVCFNLVRVQYVVEHNFLAIQILSLEGSIDKYGHSI